MNKRQQLILEIIKEKEILNQSQLIKELAKHSVSATQATVSRDIEKLKIEKVLSEDGVNRYVSANSAKERILKGVLNTFIKTVTPAANMVVIKTTTAGAPPVCAFLDEVGYREIVGTIAGDDTIFIATKSDREALELSERIRKLI